MDENQPEIVNCLRDLGFSVHCTHQIGGGFPDIVAGRGGKNYLIEVKDGAKPPSKRCLTDDEQEFHAGWKGVIHIIESVDDILNLLQIDKVDK